MAIEVLQGTITSTSGVTPTLVLAFYIDADIDLVASAPRSFNQNFDMYQGEVRRVVFTYSPTSDLSEIVDDIGWRVYRDDTIAHCAVVVIDKRLTDGEITTDGSDVLVGLVAVDTSVLEGYYNHELRFFKGNEQVVTAVGRMGVKPSIIGGG